MSIQASILLSATLLFGASSYAGNSETLSKFYHCPDQPTNPTSIELSRNSLTCNERKILTLDLQRLKNMKLTKHDPKLAKLLGVQNITNDTLVKWLEERVQYLFNKDRGNPPIKSLKDYVAKYPNTPTTYNAFEIVKNYSGDRAKTSGMTIAENVGGQSYEDGKLAGAPLFLISPEGVEKAIYSPRVGIVSIQGLFSVSFYPNSMNVLATANSIYRLGILFHEARHSDGSGRNLIFSHGTCPEGHDYEFKLSCDYSLNGPYSIGAHIMNEFLMNCEDCDEEEKGALQILIANSFTRVIKEKLPEPHNAKTIQDNCTAIGEFLITAPADTSPAALKVWQTRFDDCGPQLEYANGVRQSKWEDPTSEYAKIYKKNAVTGVQNEK